MDEYFGKESNDFLEINFLDYVQNNYDLVKINEKIIKFIADHK